jgi:hypothetical protein
MKSLKNAMVYEPTTSCARQQTEKGEWSYECM